MSQGAGQERCEHQHPAGASPCSTVPTKRRRELSEQTEERTTSAEGSPPARGSSCDGALTVHSAALAEGDKFTPPRKVKQRERQLSDEQTACAQRGENNFCFLCSGNHWMNSPHCPAKSPSRAVQRHATARAIHYPARFDSVCGGCRGAVKIGDVVSPLAGMGENGAAVWWHHG